MRRIVIAVVLAALLVGAVGTASGKEIVSSWVHTPHKHLKIRRHFTPTATPSPGMVVRIAKWERKRFGGPSVVPRARCESGLIWNNGNSTYHGLFGIGWPAWNILWPGTPRGVRLVDRHRRWARAYRMTRWASGRVTKRHIGSVHQRVKVIKKGRLPRHPDMFHGWAAIRAVQIYVARFGGGGSVVWSCDLNGVAHKIQPEIPGKVFAGLEPS